MTQTNKLNLEAEAVLDSAIQFKNPLAENSSTPRSIFLTGATGFLGVYLLDELLRQTTADIYCLIRAADADAAKERLTKKMQFYELWQEEFSARIIPVVGDLAEARYGLSEGQFSELASTIDVIYHNGALVNIVYPYAKSKAPNVLGTQEALRLASLTKTKPFHYISTMGIFFAQKVKEVKETDVPPASVQRNGYQQSKWVAEQLVSRAQERGLPASIYRPVRIMAHSQTGIIGNYDDFLYLILEGSIKMGKYPASDATINFVPMDYASRAIVHLSLQADSYGKSFHFAHSQPVSWQELFEKIATLGYPLEGVALTDWFAEIKRQATEHPKDEVYLYLGFLERVPNNIFAKKPYFDDRNTAQGLAGTSITCPPVEPELLSSYFSYFQKSGFIPAPSPPPPYLSS